MVAVELWKNNWTYWDLLMVVKIEIGNREVA